MKADHVYFYFCVFLICSYSYDLTNTLQFNLEPTKNLESTLPDQDHTHKLWKDDSVDGHVVQTPPTQDDVEDASKSCQGLLSLGRNAANPSIFNNSSKKEDEKSTDSSERKSAESISEESKCLYNIYSVVPYINFLIYHL